jgi:acyl-CoA reductase-like NAD-dependent aldehyde dehydrogenase
VGWRLRSRLGRGARCALEHGGVAPAILDETADLEDALPLLVKAGYYHAGQVCVSLQRVFVPKTELEHFVNGFAQQVEKLRVGDPTLDQTEVGPLISPREVARVESWVERALGAGGQLACGGRRLGETCYAPTIVVDPPEDCELSVREVFGPVVAVYGYQDIDEAVRRANAPDSYFQASLFTRRLDRALTLSRRLNGTTVLVNDHTAFRVDWMPFGGHRNSGLGTSSTAKTAGRWTPGVDIRRGPTRWPRMDARRRKRSSARVGPSLAAGSWSRTTERHVASRSAARRSASPSGSTGSRIRTSPRWSKAPSRLREIKT